TFFSSVFQSYPADGKVIIKGDVRWNQITIKIFSPPGIDLRTARSAGQCFIHCARLVSAASNN
ncbi:MAG: hypothetical protein AB2693_29250, partial [Candidatus Thiodiazotropha sp.]